MDISLYKIHFFSEKTTRNYSFFMTNDLSAGRSAYERIFEKLIAME